MIKNPPSSSTRPSVKELTQRFEQLSAESPSTPQKTAPQKPPRLNRNAATISETSVSATSSPSASPKTAPPKPPRLNRNAATSETSLSAASSPSTSPKTAPPKPPRLHRNAATSETSLSAASSPSTSPKVAPPKPPRLHRNAAASETSLSAASSSSTSPKVAPPKPPRLNRKTYQKESEIASAALKHSEPKHHPKDTNVVRHEVDETIQVESSVLVAKSVNLSEEQITRLSSYHALVKTYRAEIQRLCQTVYGNPNILQSQVEEIQKDPYMPTDLPERIAKNPKSISKLAGSHIWGVKNSARRDAEGYTPSLYAAVECYIEAVKYAQENLQRSPEAELKYYQRTMNRETLAQILQKPQPPTQERKPLSKEEITEKIQQHPVVARYQAQITHWSKVVFGKKDILQEHVKDLLTNPQREAELSWQVEAYPQSFSKLAGLSVFGCKNRTRKQAEAGVSHLANSIENYADTIRQLTASLTQTNQEEYKQHAQLTGLEQSFHKQQSLTETSQQRFSLKLTCRDTTENAKNTNGDSQDTQRQKVKTSKTLAFAS